MSKLFQSIFLFFIIIFISCFIGFSVVKIIDKKLNNISINLPKVELPPSNIIIKIQKENGEYKVISSKEIKLNDTSKISFDYQQKENFRNKQQKNHIERINNLNNLRPV